MAAPLPSTLPFDLPAFEQAISDAQAASIDLLRDVELNVKIELGRSKMLVEDVLKLAEGSVVELDKLAGDPVDVFVNDRLVARGEVLVLNDNFCVRVNEIMAAAREGSLMRVASFLSLLLRGRLGGGGERESALSQPPARRPHLTSPGGSGTGWAVAVLLLFASLLQAAPTSQPAPVSDYASKAVTRSHPGSTAASAGFDWQRLVLAMAVVIGVIIALRYAIGLLYPSVRAGRGSRAIRVLTRTPIAPRQQVMLLQVGRRVIVVGESGGNLSSLATITEPDEVAELIGQVDNAESPAAAGKFRSLFGQGPQ